MRKYLLVTLLLVASLGARAAFFQGMINGSVLSPVVISGISSGTPGSTTATITWTNTPAAEGQVCYGLTTSYGTCTTRDGSPVSSDSANLNGLTASTTYHYQINATAVGFTQGFSSDQTFTTASSSPGNTVVYSGVIDTQVRNNAAPTLGAAGTSTIDPDTGATVFRVTQASSCGQSSTANFLPNEGTGWIRTINSNDTAVMFLNNNSGSWFVQPLTMSGSSISFNGSCASIPLSGQSVYFSATNPALIFGLNSTFFTTYNWQTSTSTHVVNVATIPGFSLTTPYLTTCDQTDTWCATSNNTQNVGTQAAFYDINPSDPNFGNTAVVDLRNATVQFNSGAPQALTGWTTTDGAGCVIHEIIPSNDGSWFDITFDSCTNHHSPQDSFFWKVGTTTASYIKDADEVGGHEAMGVGSYYTNDPGTSEGSPNCGTYQYGQTLWDVSNIGGGVGAGNWVGVNNCNAVWVSIGSGFEEHKAWINDINDVGANTYPVMTYFQNVGSGSATALWNDEIVMIQMSTATATVLAGGPYRKWACGSGCGIQPTVWQINHTYNPTSPPCSLNYISPNISGDGKYGHFFSTWNGQTGTGSCSSQRTDDFIVVLPTASNGTTITISGISSTPLSTSATINWTNSVSSLGQVCYGTTTAYTSGCTIRDTSAVTSDSASLTGLTSSTTYHYFINSIVNGYTEGQSGDQTFTTP